MARTSTDKTESTLERKFHELGVREVLVDELRENERGKYRYIEAAYWEDSVSKGSDTVKRPGRVPLSIARGRVFSDGVNSFKIHYQETGNSRIKEYDVRGVPSWRRMDSGLFVPMVDVPKIEQSERVLWEREEFARDMQAEIEDILERYRLRSLGNAYFESKPDRRGTTLNLQVTAGADDAYATPANPESTDTGFNSTSSTDLYLAGGSGPYAGFSNGGRFTNVTIPVGATINSAVGQVYFHSLGSGTSCTSKPCFHAHDSSPNFTTTANLHPRTKTTLGTQWGSANMGTGWKSTTNAATSLQEVINRGGWVSGSALMLLNYRGGTDNGIASASPYERNSSQAMKLDIDYTAAASPGGRKNPLGYPLRGPFGGPLG